MQVCKLRIRSFRLGAVMLRIAALAVIGALVGIATAPARAATLTLYSAQHDQTVDMLTKAFAKETGIDVKVHSGEGPELASELAKEGASSRADVFFTENSPELELLSEKGLLAKVAPATLAAVPAADSGSNGDWVGVLARENVLLFNKGMIKETDLPASLIDLAKPEWKGKIAIAPTDADFLPLVGAVVAMKGRPAALDWLKGMRENAAVFDDDEGVTAAVERGAAAIGIINNYYWARLRVEKGADRIQSAIHHFAGGDVGGLMNVSGAAVLKASRNQAAAQKFLAFLVSKPAQEMLAKADITFEYPLTPGVAANPALKPRSELSPPPLTLKQIGDDRDAAQLLREAGLI
ncbi:MAG: extracellular solute-binding protein [Hyphomicrobiales bacterium]|nr:extracellular solute-binding protein [Hyphomicrobiales bacterium]